MILIILFFDIVYFIFSAEGKRFADPQALAHIHRKKKKKREEKIFPLGVLSVNPFIYLFILILGGLVSFFPLLLCTVLFFSMPLPPH